MEARQRAKVDPQKERGYNKPKERRDQDADSERENLLEWDEWECVPDVESGMSQLTGFDDCARRVKDAHADSSESRCEREEVAGAEFHAYNPRRGAGRLTERISLAHGRPAQETTLAGTTPLA